MGDRQELEAIARAMGAYTFGVVQNDKWGSEGKDIGTGVGLLWKGNYVILTAAHNVQETPEQSLYFFLPPVVLDWSGATSQSRLQLESPRIVLAPDKDLAVVVLPHQHPPASQRCFYALNAAHSTPPPGTEVTLLGYPVERRRPFGADYAATPCSGYGRIRNMGEVKCDPGHELILDDLSDVDPHGFSGSGVWHPSERAGASELRLIGLVTHCDPRLPILYGCRVEAVIEFLQEVAF